MGRAPTDYRVINGVRVPITRIPSEPPTYEQAMLAAHEAFARTKKAPAFGRTAKRGDGYVTLPTRRPRVRPTPTEG